MQCEIDDFAEEYALCDTLFGNLQIEFNDLVDEKNRITDLSPLKFIKYIAGSLTIIGIDGIENLDDFESLIHIDDWL